MCIFIKLRFHVPTSSFMSSKAIRGVMNPAQLSLGTENELHSHLLSYCYLGDTAWFEDLEFLASFSPHILPFFFFLEGKLFRRAWVPRSHCKGWVPRSPRLLSKSSPERQEAVAEQPFPLAPEPHACPPACGTGQQAPQRLRGPDKAAAGNLFVPLQPSLNTAVVSSPPKTTLSLISNYHLPPLPCPEER